MKKIFFALIGCLTAICAHAAQIVNVDYVHKLIAQKWDISIPIRADNPMQVANMKYLLTAIDVANEILNGEPTTNYGNGEFATTQIADTTATNQAVETLIKEEEIEPFCFYDSFGDEASFTISAAGKFTIDCGGIVETITKTNTDTLIYNCPRTVNLNKICITGKSTGYGNSPVFNISPDSDCSAGGDRNVYKISGSLGKIFPTLADGTQPSFAGAFARCGFLKEIPDNLFAGIKGQPKKNMFKETFELCGLLTSIPENLFAGISGAAAEGMFDSTFSGCSGLTSIPENLFGNISGTAQSYMFYQTFYNCTSLTGPSARINGKYLYEIWPSAGSSEVGDMYYDATGLSDYSSIPSAWK